MPESVTDRPTKAHEYVFLLSKSPRYFYDADAVREPHNDKAGDVSRFGSLGKNGGYVESERTRLGEVRSTAIAKPGTVREYNPAGRNVRSVWELATQPYAEAHFATFPEALVERCVKAGTSERGCCPECGAPWARVLAKEATGKMRQRATGGLGNEHRRESHGLEQVNGEFQEGVVYKTMGWKKSCACPGSQHVPCVVLDPFMGSGTTALVARTLGRRSIGVELNADYCALAARRLQQLSLLATA